MNEGIFYTNKKEQLEEFYSKDCKILCMKKLFDKFYILSDSFGTIRIFDSQRQEDVCLGIYGQHLNEVNNLRISKNNQFLMTTSKQDKCLFIWKIVFNF